MVVTFNTGFAISTVVLLQMVGLTQPESLNYLHFARGLLPLFYESFEDETKDTNAHLAESLRDCFKPSVNHESYYEELHFQAFTPSENPSFCSWRLQELLRTVEPDLSDDAFNALLRFTRGLPRDLGFKVLEPDPTPNLDRMVQIAQQFHTLDALPQSQATCSATAAQPLSRLHLLTFNILTVWRSWYMRWCIVCGG